MAAGTSVEITTGARIANVDCDSMNLNPSLQNGDHCSKANMVAEVHDVCKWVEPHGIFPHFARVRMRRGTFRAIAVEVDELVDGLRFGVSFLGYVE